MDTVLQLIQEHFSENYAAISAEVELRHGAPLSETAQLNVQAFAIKDVAYAIGYFRGEAAVFITINWGDPSVKFTWI